MHFFNNESDTFCFYVHEITMILLLTHPSKADWYFIIILLSRTAGHTESLKFAPSKKIF